MIRGISLFRVSVCGCATPKGVAIRTYKKKTYVRSVRKTIRTSAHAVESTTCSVCGCSMCGQIRTCGPHVFHPHIRTCSGINDLAGILGLKP
jgi:hypothetical protein